MKFCKTCHTFFPDDIDQCLADNTDLVIIVDTFIGKIIGGCYRILSKIADGGLSRVYRAKHMYLNREVAVKILKPELAFNEEWRKRTLREARICGSIEHRNIVRVYDMLTSEGSLCIVMELLEGETLKARLARDGMLEIETAQKIMSMTAEALARAHSLSIVHRDIKPNNIFLTRFAGIKDFVKLLDFGIAFTLGTRRMTGENMLLGTPPYSPPEQIRGHEPLPASDVYALGCVVYEMLGGRPPFGAGDMETVLQRQLHDRPEPVTMIRPQVPEELSSVIMKMLEKKAENRYSDALDLLYSLKNLDLYRSGADEEIVEVETLETEQVQVIEPSTANQWGSYFQSMEAEAEAEDDTGPTESIIRGLEAVTELGELDRRTQEIVRKMEDVETKRRSYQKNIGNAIALLGMDMSKLRSERENIKMRYLKAVSERDYMLQKVNQMEEELLAFYEIRQRNSIPTAAPDELAVLSRAGRMARKLQDVTTRVEAMNRARQKYKENLQDMKYQILQLAGSLAEAENDCSRDYEKYRKLLDEATQKGDELRQRAAMAAFAAGGKKAASTS